MVPPSQFCHDAEGQHSKFTTPGSVTKGVRSPRVLNATLRALKINQGRGEGTTFPRTSFLSRSSPLTCQRKPVPEQFRTQLLREPHKPLSWDSPSSVLSPLLLRKPLGFTLQTSPELHHTQFTEPSSLQRSCVGTSYKLSSSRYPRNTPHPFHYKPHLVGK